MPKSLKLFQTKRLGVEGAFNTLIATDTRQQKRFMRSDGSHKHIL